MRPSESPIVFIVGLTGVGKSTTLAALERSRLTFTLLPNRRTLADRIIIPEMQREAGDATLPVFDRVKRFELTRRYRQTYPGGMVHALSRYLSEHPPDPDDTLVFDSVRGLDEVKAAIKTFANARFIVLDAPLLVRLKRLIGRNDSFDQVTTARLEHTNFAEQLLAIEGLEHFDTHDLIQLTASGIPDDTLLAAVKIIVTESKNYDSGAALAYLRKLLDDTRLLSLDTSVLSVEDVAKRITEWV